MKAMIFLALLLATVGSISGTFHGSSYVQRPVYSSGHGGYAPAQTVVQQPVYYTQPVVQQRPVYTHAPVQTVVQRPVYTAPVQTYVQRPVYTVPVQTYVQRPVYVAQAPVTYYQPTTSYVVPVSTYSLPHGSYTSGYNYAPVSYAQQGYGHH